MLKYSLFPNHLTSDDPDDCVAHIQERRIVTQQELISEMTGRGLSLTDTEIERVFNEFKHVLNKHLQEGHSINTDLFTIMLSIKGAFENDEEVFTHEKHSIRFNVNLGRGIETDTTLIKTQKVPAPVKSPLIFSVHDRISETTDSRLTINGTIDIFGTDLKVNHEVADEGIFFMSDKKATKADKIYQNSDKQLQVRVPKLATGSTYTIEIRKRYRGNKQLYTHLYNTDLIVG